MKITIIILLSLFIISCEKTPKAEDYEYLISELEQKVCVSGEDVTSEEEMLVAIVYLVREILEAKELLAEKNSVSEAMKFWTLLSRTGRPWKENECKFRPLYAKVLNDWNFHSNRWK